MRLGRKTCKIDGGGPGVKRTTAHLLDKWSLVETGGKSREEGPAFAQRGLWREWKWSGGFGSEAGVKRTEAHLLEKWGLVEKSAKSKVKGPGAAPTGATYWTNGAW